MLTDLSLPALEVWRLYRGRADCENRIKELKADFGLGSFCLRDSWASEAALGVTMLAYKLPWFEGLWANAGEPVRLTPRPSNL